MALRSGADRALAMIRTLPRIGINNVAPQPTHSIDPMSPPHYKRGSGQHGGKNHGAQNKGAKKHQTFPRLGWQGERAPYYITIPIEPYYKGHHLKRQYPPVTLHDLQLLIDTKRIDPCQPIDLATISNTKLFKFNPEEKHFGFHLTNVGMDCFTAKVNIEVQWATEPVIAAIEKNGGTITTAYYDVVSLRAARDPVVFFKRGIPIPKRMLPPEDAIEYYTSAKTRGYLADPDEIAKERLVVAQKYGYTLPDLSQDPQKEMLLRRKDPRQVFFGLEPGWVVSLMDKCILKPLDKRLVDYYKT